METILSIFRRLMNYILQLNYFEDEICRTDLFHLRSKIIATRIYIIVFLTSLITLVILNMMGTQPNVIIIRNPSEKDYIDFIETYRSSSTSCPCSNVTIPYGKFISTNVIYHPVCSSIFVSNNWINYLFNPNFANIYQGDFRALANSYFQLLSTLCLHVNRSIDNILNDFKLDTLLSPNILANKSLFDQIEVKSLFLKSITNNSIIQLLELIRTVTKSNVLQTAIPLSALMYDYPEDRSLRKKNIIFKYMNSSCNCTSAARCYVPSGFFDIKKRTQKTISLIPDFPRLANLSGFVVGCFPLESLLQSTLECLFDLLCLNIIQKYVISTINITDVYTLNQSQTRFFSNTSVESLVKELFIESWSIEANFSKYYNECSPVLCTHTLEQANNVFYAVTKMFGLYSGLRFIFSLFIPFIVTWWRKRRIINLEENRRNGSLIQHLERTQYQIRMELIEINLFKTPEMRTDSFEYRSSKISTWIYLVTFCFSMIIIVLITSFDVQMENKIVENPSLINFTDLETNFSGSFQCPCSQIAISHSSFISLFPRFHPVCMSWLISDQWIDDISSLDMHPTLSLHKDFLRHAPPFFISLKTFCEFMKLFVSNALFMFNQSSLITNQAITNVELEARTQQVIKEFKSNTKAESKRTLDLVLFQIGTMYTTGDNDASWHLDKYFTLYQPMPQKINDCSCQLNDTCKQQLGFYDYRKENGRNVLQPDISNMFSGCSTIESLRQSSLECFFSQVCVNGILEKIYSFPKNHGKTWKNITILEISSTRFYPETSLKDIINDMMIDKWDENINYNKYYEKCAPQICTYFLITRNNFLYVLTTIISLLAGISIILRILMPIIVNRLRNTIYRRTTENNNQTNSYTIFQRIYNIWCKIKTKIIELNLFKSESSLNNETRLHYEIITTRIYIILLIVSIIILIFYTTVSVRPHNIIDKSLTQSKFKSLISNPDYLSTLDCPCQNISISYNSFIFLSPNYHQICSSDFIINNSQWINLINRDLRILGYRYDDYRRFAASHFRLLFHLCTLAKNTTDDALDVFRSNILVSKRAQSHQAIVEQMNASIKQFISSISQTFTNTLDFNQQIAHGNGFMSTTGSNWYMELEAQNNVIKRNDDKDVPILIFPHFYDNNICSCAKYSTCSSLATTNAWTVPGFHVGCYPFQSLLQSTLECLYNENCIKKLQENNPYSNITFHPLNPDLSLSNETVQTILNKLMVDRWKYDISYDNYYKSCSPILCTYIIKSHFNMLYIITTIVSIFTGLNVTLKIVTPLIAKIFIKMSMRRQRQIQPTVAIIDLH